MSFQMSVGSRASAAAVISWNETSHAHLNHAAPAIASSQVAQQSVFAGGEILRHIPTHGMNTLAPREGEQVWMHQNPESYR